MGVITLCSLAKGKVFGPIPPNLTLTDPAVLIGHMTADTRPDVHTVKLDLSEYAEGARLAEWVPYVQAAREEKEQNMEAYVSGGLLYYRCVRDVRAGSELAVWYSEDFAQILGVQELQSIHFTENGTMCCPYCGQTFRFPFSLRAHLRFKCETLRKAMHMDTSSIRPSLGMPPLGVTPATWPRAYPGQGGLTLSPTTSLSSSAGTPSPPGPRSPGHHSPVKPKAEPDHPLDRSARDSGIGDSVRDSPDSDKSISVSPARDSKADEETGSAFRKVERHAMSVAASSVSSAPKIPSSGAPYSSFLSPGSISQDKSLLRLHDKNMNPTSTLAAAMYGRYPPVGVGGLPGMPGVPVNENLPLNLTDNASKLNGLPRALADRLTDINNIENNNVYRKVPFYTDRRLAVAPYFKSNNPMVGKLLHTSTAPAAVMQSSFPNLGLVQNWCAKCNATFRMTSDLVYHMRSHHKREFDPLKRKREEKLRCDTCGETFRERHHLSRHMTSHT